MSARYAIGIGARRDIDARELAGFVREVAARHGVDLQSATLATIEARGDEPGLQGAARLLDMAVVFLSLENLRARDKDVRDPIRSRRGNVWRRQRGGGGGARGGWLGEHFARAARRDDAARLRHRPREGWRRKPMTVHFIGAGPGAADLLTLRGRDLIARCPVCLYAGSLVPVGVLAHCPPGARIVDTAPLSLDAIIAEMQAAQDAGLDVARLHSGDLSIWSAVGEQTRRLERLKIPFTLTPGVPSFAAAAAALGRELTLPEVAQSLVLTRTSGRASAMPASESLSAFAATRATMAIHLSIHALARVVGELTPFYGDECPIALVYRASWPDERIVRGTLADHRSSWRARRRWSARR